MSVAADIADAVEDAVAALALTGLTVVRRKTPAVPEGATLPQAVVSVGDEQVEDLTATQALVTYTVAVTVVTAGGSKLADDDVLHAWRQSIRRKLEDLSVWAAVAGFNEVRNGGVTPFDAAALPRDFNYSTLTFRVSALESRT